MKLILKIAGSLALLSLPTFTNSYAQTADSVKWHYAVGTAGVLAFSGVNANITAEAAYKRHTLYIGPKMSVADAYLPSTAPFGFTAGYKFFINTEPGITGKFDFFVFLDYQLEYHKAFRGNDNLPKRYNTLHELNAGYGLQYNISDKLAVNNVLGFGRYQEVFRNPRTGTEAKFDGWNRMVRVQLLYKIR